ncbi:MAG TPA: PKD-like domain-containing protein, partial [Chryseosolibacter sp.]|nr:PKD-like domain-containing protein [Chryseosolibacter sp.]
MARITAALFVLFTILHFTSSAQVTISNNGDNACIGTFTTISDIVITETAPGDISLPGPGGTIVFTSSMTFNSPGSATVVVTGGGGSLTGGTVTVSNNSFTVTLNQSNTTHEGEINTITISGIEVDPPGGGGWTINESGGTATINGLSSSGQMVATAYGGVPPTGGNDAVTVCSNNGPSYDLQVNVNSFGNGVGSNFSWTSSAGPNISGETTGSGGFIGDILTNTGTSPETVTYTVTPTNSTYGCVGPTFEVVVTV